MNREQIIEILKKHETLHMQGWQVVNPSKSFGALHENHYAAVADEILALQKEEVKEKKSDILRNKLEQEMADRSKQGILTSYGQLPSWKEYEQALQIEGTNLNFISG